MDSWWSGILERHDFQGLSALSETWAMHLMMQPYTRQHCVQQVYVPNPHNMLVSIERSTASDTFLTVKFQSQCSNK